MLNGRGEVELRTTETGSGDAGLQKLAGRKVEADRWGDAGAYQYPPARVVNKGARVAELVDLLRQMTPPKLAAFEEALESQEMYVSAFKTRMKDGYD